MQPRTSNPARAVLSAGGVGRNVAENLARWGVHTLLVSGVGDDVLSRSVVDATAASGVDVSLVRSVPDTCGIYAALLDADGTLALAASAMDAIESLDAGWVDHASRVVADASLLVLDANVPVAALQQALRIANAHGVPVIAEPVSVAKTRRLAGLDGTVFVLTPNEDEYAAFLAAEPALRVRHHLVTRGPGGIRWLSEGAEDRDLPASPAVAVDETGAGDALVAGVAYGMCAGASLAAAVRFGMETARRTVECEGSVATGLDSEEARRLLERMTKGGEA